MQRNDTPAEESICESHVSLTPFSLYLVKTLRIVANGQVKEDESVEEEVLNLLLQILLARFSHLDVLHSSARHKRQTLSARQLRKVRV